MSEVPIFGFAVQAPSVTAPKANPRVVASHVALRPTMAATHSANSKPMASRTIDPSAYEKVRSNQRG
jgi:hypothetical protein